MIVKFNPNAPMPEAVMPEQAAGISSLPGLMMAPVGLTPLAQPASLPAGASLPSARGDGLAAMRRQVYFAGKQQVLLERLAKAPEATQGSALSAAQRNACVAVLATVAAAVASHVNE